MRLSLLRSMWMCLILLTAQVLGQDTGLNLALQLGATVKRNLRLGERHSYSITIPSGQFVHFLLDAKEVDIVVVLRDPTGNPVAEWDMSYETPRPQSFVAIAKLPGVHHLDVRLSDDNEKAGDAGDYSMVLHELRSATENDQKRIQAEGELRKAEDLHPRREAIEHYRLALAGFREVKENKRTARALMSLGDIYDSLNDKAAALQFFQQLEALLVEVDGPILWQSFNRLGIFYSDTFDNEKALECLERARASSCSSGMPANRGAFAGAACSTSTYFGMAISRTVSRISTNCAAPVFGWVSSLRRSAQ